uniref:SURP motif domain-containing protein n=1 Tax=Branchiostoma floridae TaxID=7739 RepID=C4A0X1_BRAFL|eukprot:XP_002585549.1 hypothetical protein BRAFLDRAFT_90869 [Branchiostoma floridae]
MGSRPRGRSRLRFKDTVKWHLGLAGIGRQKLETLASDRAGWGIVPNEQPPPEPKKPTVGIIYPPPEVRNIVDKTASFVARNGPEFESRIRQNEINNPKFNFLNPSKIVIIA